MAVKGIEAGIIFLVLITILGTSVYAINQKVIIDIPGSFILNGKNITVLGSSSDKISVDIDGVLANVEQDKIQNTSTYVNGVLIQIIALSSSPQRAILNITVEVECGNNICEIGEDYAICCADCGCGVSSQVCNNNRCREDIKKKTAVHECYVDEDCSDHDSCTSEHCDTSAYPNRCIRTDVTACIVGDNCCPKGCDTDRDTDCEEVDKCETDFDCFDNEVCTQELCTGTPKRCESSSQTGCTYENACIKEGTVKEGRYCEGTSHEWLLQKVDGLQCTEDYECINGLCSDKRRCGEEKSRSLQYAFYTIGIIAIIITIWYVSLIRRSKP